MLNNTVLEAKGVWKGCGHTNGSYRWILKEVNLEFWEGEFISILGKPDSGKSTLLKVLSFLEAPDQGEVYFQGRLVGESGAEELAHMQKERIWLIDYLNPAKTLPQNLAVVLLDNPHAFPEPPLYPPLNPEAANPLFSYIRYLNSRGITVVMTTRDPVEASRAASIYKLHRGKVDKLNGTAK